MGLIGYAWWAGRATGTGAPAPGGRDHGFRLKECAKERGIDFVHPAPVLDAQLAHGCGPRLDRLAPLAVSVRDGVHVVEEALLADDGGG